MSRPVVRVLVVLAIGGLLALAWSPAGAVPPVVPWGWVLVDQRKLAPGVEFVELRREEGPVRAHVVRIGPDAPVQLRAVLSNDRVGGPPPLVERTTEMCRRVACLAALNADFSHPNSGLPVGGLVTHGRLLRSPVPSHHQLWVGGNGRLAAGVFSWSGRLVLSDLGALVLDGLNVNRGADQLVLYTPAHGPTTGTNDHGAELLLRMVEPQGPLRLNRTAVVELVELRDGGGHTKIPAAGAVVSGHGMAAQELRDAWGRVQAGTAAPRALIRLVSEPEVTESVGARSCSGRGDAGSPTTAPPS